MGYGADAETKADADHVADAFKTTITSAAQATAAGADKMKETMSQAATATNQAFKDGMDKSLSTLNELNTQAKQNLEALVASMTAATRGAEALGAQAMAYTKKSVEDQVEQAKSVAAARSLQEVIELQTAFAKSSMEAYIAELNRAAETITSVVKDAFRPLNERASSVVETLQSTR